MCVGRAGGVGALKLLSAVGGAYTPAGEITEGLSARLDSFLLRCLPVCLDGRCRLTCELRDKVEA